MLVTSNKRKAPKIIFGANLLIILASQMLGTCRRFCFGLLPLLGTWSAHATELDFTSVDLDWFQLMRLGEIISAIFALFHLIVLSLSFVSNSYRKLRKTFLFPKPSLDTRNI